MTLIKVGVVSEFDNEIICAAKNKQNEFVLLYAVVNGNGNLEVKIKSNKKENMTKLVADLKAAAKFVWLLNIKLVIAIVYCFVIL